MITGIVVSAGWGLFMYFVGFRAGLGSHKWIVRERDSALKHVVLLQELLVQKNDEEMDAVIAIRSVAPKKRSRSKKTAA